MGGNRLYDEICAGSLVRFFLVTYCVHFSRSWNNCNLLLLLRVCVDIQIWMNPFLSSFLLIHFCFFFFSIRFCRSVAATGFLATLRRKGREYRRKKNRYVTTCISCNWQSLAESCVAWVNAAWGSDHLKALGKSRLGGGGEGGGGDI